VEIDDTSVPDTGELVDSPRPMDEAAIMRVVHWCIIRNSLDQNRDA